MIRVLVNTARVLYAVEVPEQRYADILRERMDGHENGLGRPISLRELANRVGKSYEQCRKVLAGQPVVSRELNDEIARVLRLDAEPLWSVALREKATKRYGPELLAATGEKPWDEELQRKWEGLTDEQRDHLLALTNSMIETNLRRRKRRIRASGQK